VLLKRSKENLKSSFLSSFKEVLHEVEKTVEDLDGRGDLPLLVLGILAEEAWSAKSLPGCHRDESLSKKDAFRKTVSLLYQAGFKNSVHETLCSDCHTKITDIPTPRWKKPPTGVDCEVAR
jgi:hypothetical protein